MAVITPMFSVPPSSSSYGTQWTCSGGASESLRGTAESSSPVPQGECVSEVVSDIFGRPNSLFVN